jgi:uncharacterized membrane protein
MSMTHVTEAYRVFLHTFAEMVACTLELIGILISLVGTVKALLHLVHRLRRRGKFNVVSDLGRSLALALECKMGAEIIHTVVVRDPAELGILVVVILIRALLAFIIHWEIRMEQRTEPDEGKNS